MQGMPGRLKKLWLYSAAAVAALAGLMVNLDTIASYAARWLGPWLRQETRIDVLFDAPHERTLILAIAEGSDVLDTQTIHGGMTARFRVPAHARYTLVWQGPRFKAASIGDILAPSQSYLWRLALAGREEETDLLKLLAEGLAEELQTAAAPASLLVSAQAAVFARNPALRNNGFALLPELDRAVAVIGLFEQGTTDCALSYWVTRIGIGAGCVGASIPGALGGLITQLDRDHPELINETFGETAALLRDLVAADFFEQTRRIRAIYDDKQTLERLRRGTAELVRTPAFRVAHQGRLLAWYRQALATARSLGLQSERGVLFVIDRQVTQGSAAFRRIRAAYDAQLAEHGDIAAFDDRTRLGLLAQLVIDSTPAGRRKSVASRVETIVSGKRTMRGVAFDLNALGIRDDVPMTGTVP